MPHSGSWVAFVMIKVLVLIYRRKLIQFNSIQLSMMWSTMLGLMDHVTICDVEQEGLGVMERVTMGDVE